MQVAPIQSSRSPSLYSQHSASIKGTTLPYRLMRRPSSPTASGRTSAGMSRLERRSGLRRSSARTGDPARKIIQRHAQGLKRVDFLSDQIDRLSVNVEKRKVKLATLKNFNETLDDVRECVCCSFLVRCCTTNPHLSTPLTFPSPHLHNTRRL